MKEMRRPAWSLKMFPHILLICPHDTAAPSLTGCRAAPARRITAMLPVRGHRGLELQPWPGLSSVSVQRSTPLRMPSGTRVRHPTLTRQSFIWDSKWKQHGYDLADLYLLMCIYLDSCSSDANDVMFCYYISFTMIRWGDPITLSQWKEDVVHIVFNKQISLDCLHIWWLLSSSRLHVCKVISGFLEKAQKCVWHFIWTAGWHLRQRAK